MWFAMNFVDIVLLTGLSMSVEYINAILGMGYGTVMVPFLLLLGLDPVLVVFTIITKVSR